MSYEVLVKEAQALPYEEQINLMAALANSIKESTKKPQDRSEIQKKLDSLNMLANLYTDEELKPVEDSISAGIAVKDINL